MARAVVDLRRTIAAGAGAVAEKTFSTIGE
jgi:hypothetical protein